MVCLSGAGPRPLVWDKRDEEAGGGRRGASEALAMCGTKAGVMELPFRRGRTRFWTLP